MSDYSKIVVGQKVRANRVGKNYGHGTGEVTEIGKKSFTVRMKADAGGRAWNQKFGIDGISMGSRKGAYQVILD